MACRLMSISEKKKKDQNFLASSILDFQQINDIISSFPNNPLLCSIHEF
jgi:hypothetical protein